MASMTLNILIDVHPSQASILQMQVDVENGSESAVHHSNARAWRGIDRVSGMLKAPRLSQTIQSGFSPIILVDQYPPS